MDTFVATFIGSPPMNLVEDGAIWLGFRPEAFLPREVGSASDSVAFPFRVTRVEYLGADRLIYGVIEGRSPEAHVISKLPNNIRVEIAAGRHIRFRRAQERHRPFRSRERTAPRWRRAVTTAPRRP